MKKSRILGLMAAFALAITFSSCNSDTESSSTSIPVDQQKSMVSALGSYHTGAWIYYNENKLNTKDVTDTIPNIMASVTTGTNKDTNGNITSYYGKVTYQFPVQILKNWINDTELAEKVSNMSPVTVNSYLVPYNYSQNLFVANTEDIVLGDITTSSQTYKNVTVKFYANVCSAGLEYNTSKTQTYLYFYLWAGRIYVDGNESSLLTNYIFNNNTYAPHFMFSVKAMNN